MWTVKLFRVNQMPSDFQEPFIISKYRSSRSSLLCCLKSMFQPTNETLNFWTHFLPLLYFMWKLSSLAFIHNFFTDSYAWPLCIYLISVCGYLFGSSTAHLFNCLSDHARHVCFFFDYAAITCYGAGTAIAYRFYGFPSSWIGGYVYRAYLPVTMLMAVTGTASACSSRFGDREKLKKVLRLSSFAVPYLIDSVPLVVRLWICHSEDCPDESFKPHLRQFLVAPFVAFLFATHFPECVAPGKFDVVGHSHQLFHILVAFATNDQLNGLTWDMVHRREYLIAHGAEPTFFWSLGIGLLVFLTNALLVYIFSELIKDQRLFRKCAGTFFYSQAGEGETVNNNKDIKSS